ncbi:uncharacterized protein F4812DRAFT_451650 [Daldinia caldariorum]|uniref:uncharacterized protein n=1 Tax=Daldinia caldariorum TaxID=326644 RepID=UPI002008C29D|nr:uncharacterized protein F4812DRAFT_451650 [Daldinia caldariorum]KAI1466693.1 hypothetical protein F4812DRAFT_451650 [Daldinia caldariorum]
MAGVNVKMLNIGFSMSDKADNTEHVRSLLRTCRALLDKYRKSPSEFDLDDAFFAVQDALIIASDPGVCEYPPLATCYLYKGHVLWIMKKYQEAQNAYRRASKTLGNGPADRKASEQALSFAAVVDQKVRDEKRKGGMWAETYDLDFPDIDSWIPSLDDSHDEKPTNSDFHYACPPIQKVEARRTPRIDAPEFPHRPVQPTPCYEAMIQELVPSSPGTRKLRSMRGRQIDSTSFHDH